MSVRLAAFLFVCLLALPVAAQTPSQPPQPIITAENAAQLHEAAVLGRGVPKALAWSWDGSQLAVATRVGVWLYNPADPAAAPVLLADQNGATSAAFHPNGQLLAIGSDDGSIALWDVASREKRASLLNHLYTVHLLTFSQDGSLLASADHSGITRLWDIDSNSERTVVQHPGVPNRVAFHPGGAEFATGGEEGTRVWSVEGELVRELDPADLLTYDGLGNLALADGNQLTLWDETGMVWSVPADFDGEIRALLLRLGEVHVVLARDDHFALVQPLTGHLMWELPLPADAELLSFNLPEQAMVAYLPDQGEVSLWALPYATEQGGFSGFHESFTSLLVEDGQIMAGDHGGQVASWAAGEQLLRFDSNHEVTALARFEGTLYAAVGDKSVRRWDHTTGTPERLAGHNGRVTALSSSENMLASAGTDSMVLLWNDSGYHVLAHNAPVLAVALSSDGAALVSGQEDGMVRVWDTELREQRFAVQAHNAPVRSAAFQPDGTLVASGGDDSVIKLLNAETGETVTELHGHIRTVNALAFSPAGDLLASGSNDGTVRVWQVASGETLVTLEGHTSGVTALAFSADGGQLVTTGFDGTVRVWTVG